MHWSRQICSAFLVAAFTLGILAEGHHQCVTVPDHTSASHTQHTDDPASDQQAPHECDCLSHCCSLIAVPSGVLHGFRLAAEGIVPFYQKLDGPQLETDWVLMLGAQYTIELGIGH